MSHVETSRCVHTARFEGDGITSLLQDISHWYRSQRPRPILWDIIFDPEGNRATVYHDGFEPTEAADERE